MAPFFTRSTSSGPQSGMNIWNEHCNSHSVENIGLIIAEKIARKRGTFIVSGAQIWGTLGFKKAHACNRSVPNFDQKAHTIFFQNDPWLLSEHDTL